MNWLAHLLLSEASDQFRLGNLLPDFASGPDLKALSQEFRRGIECHRRIDAFTDAHPVFRQSRKRIGTPMRRYAGILVDVFYDHILSREWENYAQIPMEQLIGEVYRSVSTESPNLPAIASARLHQMRAEDWLGSYADVSGIERVLQRMARRLRRPVDLGAAVIDLEESYDGFLEDFRVFFPELQAHVKTL